MTNGFDKTHTQAVKGVAILILLAHHILGHYCLFQIPGSNIKIFVVYVTKVCVTLFTILSGYGITKSYFKKNTKDIKFVGTHLKKLLINYWFVYIPMLIISFYEHSHGTPIEIYGNGIKGIISGLLDFIGMKELFKTATLNQTWWYMAVPIICYLLFPFFYRAVKKSKIGTLIVSIIPCIAADIIAIKTHSRADDSILFYIFPFIVGIILANENLLDKLIEFYNKKVENKWIVGLTSVSAIIVFAILSSFSAFVINVFYAISIIVLVSVIKNNKQRFLGIFELLGR